MIDVTSAEHNQENVDEVLKLEDEMEGIDEADALYLGSLYEYDRMTTAKPKESKND